MCPQTHCDQIPRFLQYSRSPARGHTEDGWCWVKLSVMMQDIVNIRAEQSLSYHFYRLHYIGPNNTNTAVSQYKAGISHKPPLSPHNRKMKKKTQQTKEKFFKMFTFFF